ncbi:MAG TPA: hypothetical protein VIF37_16310 [Methylobacter sp.]|jgi:hypothetical protein
MDKAYNLASVKRLVMRIRLALRTNESQIMAVLMFTCVNGIALVKRTGNTPIWFVVAVMAFWPVLAFVLNLVNPLPDDDA